MNDLFQCRFCGETLVGGNKVGNERHFLDKHVPEWIDELERQGMGELEAHAKENTIIASWGSSETR